MIINGWYVHNIRHELKIYIKNDIASVINEVAILIEDEIIDFAVNKPLHVWWAIKNGTLSDSIVCKIFMKIGAAAIG